MKQFRFFHKHVQNDWFSKELDFKELEIHGYSLMDTINEYQWISINEYQWISINEFIDGHPSMNMVPFLWALSLAPIGPPLGPNGKTRLPECPDMHANRFANLSSEMSEHR